MRVIVRPRAPKLVTDEMSEDEAQARLADTVQVEAKKSGVSEEEVADVTPDAALAAARSLTPEVLSKLSDAALKKLVGRMRECSIVLARTDVNEFTRLVLRDERTGKHVLPAEHHREWHDFLDAHDRAVVWSHVEAAKTQTIGVARQLWKLGRNPNTLGAFVSNTYGQAEKVIRAMGLYIEQSSDYKQVFPRIQKAEPWTANSITVARDTYAKEASIQACGFHGNILGSRLDDVVVDDLLDYENTRTKTMRQETVNWYNATITGRLLEGGTVTMAGTAWHPEDLMHVQADAEGWAGRRWPVLREDGTSNWGSRWSLARIEKRRLELGPLEFARQMMCQARDDASRRFKREWIDTCLRKGDGFPLIYSRLDAGVDPALEATWDSGKLRIYTGVDLAVSKKSSADETVFFTIAVYPNGTRRLLWIDAGKLHGPDIISALISTWQRFGSLFVVESVAAQAYIIQFANRLTSIPIVPFQTSSKKWNPEFGVESMGAEMAGGKWIIPNSNGRMQSQVNRWVGEMLDYDPKQHTGDRLMASYFAREQARIAESRTPEISMRVIGAPPRRRLPSNIRSV